MKFEEAIKMVGKQYIQEEIKCREENDITIKLPVRFKIRMWWMFKKEKFKSYYLEFFMDHCNMQWSIFFSEIH